MIIVDVETTGHDPRVNSMFDIGAVDFNKPEKRFSIEFGVRPGALVADEGWKHHGAKLERLLDRAVTPHRTAVFRFFDWVDTIDDKTIGGMNPDFDESFLHDAADRYCIKWPFVYRKVDQHSLAYASMLKNGFDIPMNEKGGSGLYGDRIMEYVGIPPEPRPHLGINGAEWETEALSRLIYGRNKIIKFSSCPIPPYLRQSPFLRD